MASAEYNTKMLCTVYQKKLAVIYDNGGFYSIEDVDYTGQQSLTFFLSHELQ